MYAKNVSLIYTLSKNGPKFIFSSHCYKVREDISKMALDYVPAVKKIALCLFVIVSYVPSRLLFLLLFVCWVVVFFVYFWVFCVWFFVLFVVVFFVAENSIHSRDLIRIVFHSMYFVWYTL